MDTSFLVDLLKEEPAATERAAALEGSGERPSVPAVALTELLIGAYYRGGSFLNESLELAASLQVIDTDAEIASEAARIGADLLRRGEAMSQLDLVIAATARLRQAILVTRDRAFARIPGLAVETY